MLTRDQLIECWDCVFTEEQCDNFKHNEMHNLIYNDDYVFMESPKDNWEEDLYEKIEEIKNRQYE